MPRLEVKRAQGGPDHYGPGTGYTGPHMLYRYHDPDGPGGPGQVWYRTEARARESWVQRAQRVVQAERPPGPPGP